MLCRETHEPTSTNTRSIAKPESTCKFLHPDFGKKKAPKSWGATHALPKSRCKNLHLDFKPYPTKHLGYRPKNVCALTSAKNVSDLDITLSGQFGDRPRTTGGNLVTENEMVSIKLFFLTRSIWRYHLGRNMNVVETNTKWFFVTISVILHKWPFRKKPLWKTHQKGHLGDVLDNRNKSLRYVKRSRKKTLRVHHGTSRLKNWWIPNGQTWGPDS